MNKFLKIAGAFQRTLSQEMGEIAAILKAFIHIWSKSQGVSGSLCGDAKIRLKCKENGPVFHEFVSHN